MKDNNLDLSLADWQGIYETVLACGNAHHPRAFAIDLIKNIGKIIEFDQSIAYFFDSSGKACGQYQKNISEKYSNLYLKYHEALEGTYNPFGYSREDPSNPTIILFDWGDTNYYPDDVMQDLIRPRRLTYSCDFGLFDISGRVRLLVALDRTKKRNFSQKEIVNLTLAVRQLNSLYKNFFFRDDMLGKVTQREWAEWKLTAREIEVVDLVVQGVNTKEIAKTLYISIATVNKHMQHIHEKMKVSSNRELLAKLMRTSDLDI